MNPFKEELQKYLIELMQYYDWTRHTALNVNYLDVVRHAGMVMSFITFLMTRLDKIDQEIRETNQSTRMLYL